MWRPMLRKRIEAFSKKQIEKSTGSLQSKTILTLHLEVGLDGALTTLGEILELSDIILLPDTFLGFHLSEYEESFRKTERPIFC